MPSSRWRTANPSNAAVGTSSARTGESAMTVAVRGSRVTSAISPTTSPLVKRPMQRSAVLVAKQRMGCAFEQNQQALRRLALRHHGVAPLERTLYGGSQHALQDHWRQRRERPTLAQQIPYRRVRAGRRHIVRRRDRPGYDGLAGPGFGVGVFRRSIGITSCQCQPPWTVLRGRGTHRAREYDESRGDAVVCHESGAP